MVPIFFFLAQIKWYGTYRLLPRGEVAMLVEFLIEIQYKVSKRDFEILFFHHQV